MPPQFARRFTLGVLSSFGLAVGANFSGITSLFLSINPEAARGLRLDVVYPVGGYFRCLDTDKGFEFIYPQEWVGDQRILYRAVERAEQARSFDLPPLSSRHKTASSNTGTGPVVAFGPPGTSGELNVSVVVAPIASGFTLRQLGDAREAGSLILNRYIAPEGSNKTATLLDAYSKQQGDKGVVYYYTLEYQVKGPKFFRHNVAVYAVRENQLYSLNVQTPEEKWASNKEKCIAIANSFRVNL